MHSFRKTNELTQPAERTNLNKDPADIFRKIIENRSTVFAVFTCLVPLDAGERLFLEE